MALALAGCTESAVVPAAVSPTPAAKAVTPTAPLPTAVPPTPAASPSAVVAVSEGPALLTKAVEGLDRAKSYRFTIEAVYHWRTPDGQETDFAFTGQGAAIPPNRFRSEMTGPVDTVYQVKMIDGKVTNVDARGLAPQASTAFGGPGVGAAPFTVISYLKNGTVQGQSQSASLNGTDTRRFSFVPDLARVSAMDASHAAVKDRVQAVQGVAWVDAKTGRVLQETATVQSSDQRGSPQTVTITLKFSDYDAPVEIN